MRIIKAKPHHLSQRIAKHGEAYASELMPALVERKPDGSLIFDADHPAWIEAVAKYRGAVAVSPCVGCGDKTNIAQIRTSPIEMERMLSGD